MVNWVSPAAILVAINLETLSLTRLRNCCFWEEVAVPAKKVSLSGGIWYLPVLARSSWVKTRLRHSWRTVSKGSMALNETAVGSDRCNSFA